jgi:hypothetical protein
MWQRAATRRGRGARARAPPRVPTRAPRAPAGPTRAEAPRSARRAAARPAATAQRPYGSGATPAERRPLLEGLVTPLSAGRLFSALTHVLPSSKYEPAPPSRRRSPPSGPARTGGGAHLQPERAEEVSDCPVLPFADANAHPPVLPAVAALALQHRLRRQVPHPVDHHPCAQTKFYRRANKDWPAHTHEWQVHGSP